MILIYSKDIDDFLNRVIDCLDNNFIRIGNRDLIEIDEVSLINNLNFKISGYYFGSADLKEITAVWFNGGVVNNGSALYENLCTQSLIDSILTHLDVFKLGRLYSDFENNKLHASLEAKKQGLKVPETLITGNKKDLMKFYKKNKSKGIVCKRIVDSHFYNNEEYTFNFASTILIDLDLVVSVPNYFSLSLFQERIPIDFEVRAIYLNGKFYAASIHDFKDKTNKGLGFNDSKQVRIVPFKLPKTLEIKLKLIFQNLNINYGSADLIYYNKEFYFLEINPSGQIGFINEACNFYLEERISELFKNEKKRTNKYAKEPKV